MEIFYAILLTIIILGFLNVKPKISKTEGILIIILAFILALIQAGLAFFIIYNFAYALVTGTLF